MTAMLSAKETADKNGSFHLRFVPKLMHWRVLRSLQRIKTDLSTETKTVQRAASVMMPFLKAQKTRVGLSSSWSHRPADPKKFLHVCITQSYGREDTVKRKGKGDETKNLWKADGGINRDQGRTRDGRLLAATCCLCCFRPNFTLVINLPSLHAAGGYPVLWS